MKNEKVKNLLANLHDKTEYVTRIKNLKQRVNQGLVLKKIRRVNKFTLKSYTDMNTDPRKKAKRKRSKKKTTLRIHCICKNI